jgi:hypothetical protein
MDAPSQCETLHIGGTVRPSRQTVGGNDLDLLTGDVWKTRGELSSIVAEVGSDAKYGSVSKPCTPGEHQNSW